MSSNHDLSGKRRPSASITTPDGRLAAFVRQQLESTQQWKLDKHSPADKENLLRLARNLYDMLKRVPRGRKKHVVARAGFGDGDVESSTPYAQYVTIPSDKNEVSADRWRRLTPNIGAYVAVAKACPPEGDAAIAELFRGTTWEAGLRNTAFQTAWMQELTRAIRRMADGVAARTSLGPLFDRLSAANVCLRDGARHQMAITNWLSVTFHKTDPASNGSESAHQPFWLADRENEGAPRGGAALFSPRICLTIKTLRFSLVNAFQQEPSEQSFERALLRIDCSHFLALLPSAAALDQPAGVEPAFLLRAEMKLDTEKGEFPITFVRPENGRLKLGWQDEETCDLYCYLADLDEAVWLELTDNSLPLLLEGDDCIDLQIGLWRVLPLGSEAGERVLESAAEGLQFRAPPLPERAREILLHYEDDANDIDLSGLLPSRFAPSDSLAGHLQRSLGREGPIARSLEADAMAFHSALERLAANAANLFAEDREEPF